MMNEHFGWRGKIGLIINSGQVITEPLYNRVAPEGVCFYASRVLVKGSVLESHQSMVKEAFRAGSELATANVDCLAYCCTVSGILHGIEGDKEFCRQMEKETGVSTTSTLSAILEALAVLGIKKLMLVSPYDEETHATEEKFFRENGYEIQSSRHMELSRKQRTSTTPAEIYRFCRSNWDDRADGLLISCMNFNAMPCIGPLEKDLGRPVLSSHSATLWKVLTMLRLGEPLAGYGQLLTIKK